MSTILNRLVGAIVICAVTVCSLSHSYSLNAKAEEKEVEPVVIETLRFNVNDYIAFEDDVTNNVYVSAGISKEFNSILAGIEITATEDVYTEETVNQKRETLPTITDVDCIKYVACDYLNVRNLPNTDGEKIAVLAANTEVHVTGIIADSEFVRIEYKGESYYVASEYLSDEKVDRYIITAPTEELNSYLGTITDSYGYRLTYYDLDMSKCIEVMRRKGYTDEVWVDQYGYKRLGKYIMAAGAYKKGTILKCSQGEVIIVDHGSFEETYGKAALDLCAAWDS